MIERIFAVAQLTFIKIREPAFMLMMLFAIGLGFGVSEMEALNFQQDDVILTHLVSGGSGLPVLAGFAIILAATLMIAIFTGATDIPRDIESRMVMLILAKPIKRGEYLIGKYLGICGICILFFALSGISCTISHFLRAGEWYPASLLLRQLMLLAAVFPFVAMTMMISCFLSDLSAMIATSVYIIFSVSVGAIPLLVELLPESIGINAYLYMFYYLFPNYLYFFQNFRLVGLVMPMLIIYAASITTIFLLISNFRLTLRDMI